MALFRNNSTVPLTVLGAGLAEPGQTLEVPEGLATGLTGPSWERLDDPTANHEPTEDPAAPSNKEA